MVSIEGLHIFCNVYRCETTRLCHRLCLLCNVNYWRCVPTLSCLFCVAGKQDRVTIGIIDQRVTHAVCIQKRSTIALIAISHEFCIFCFHSRLTLHVVFKEDTIVLYALARSCLLAWDGPRSQEQGELALHVDHQGLLFRVLLWNSK